MMICSSGIGSATRNIVFNIVGGLLTVPSAAALAFLWTKFRNREFKKIFGPGKKSFAVAYGSLIVQPGIIDLYIPPEKQQQFRLFPFAKPSVPNRAYSAENIASGCELRGLGHLASGLSADGGIDVTVVSDESVKEKVDLDFISLGATNNLKTLDLFSNENNVLATYSDGENAFIPKSIPKPLYRPSPGQDYGIILRIHPRQFPTRTWLCCAGYGEWGTSGCAWFLGKKWREIGRRIGEDDQFLAVISVNKGQDESAELISLFRTPKEIENSFNR